MANSCPKCHAAVVAGTRTCQFCGAPVEYIEPAEQSLQDEVAAREEAEDRRIAEALAKALPPPKRKVKAAKAKPKKPGLSTTAKAVAGPIAVVFILFVMSRLMLVFPTMLGGSSISITPVTSQPGASSASSLGTGELGVDVYPGARALADGDRSNSPEKSVISQAFVTDDQMNMVINFYKTRMTGQTSIYASGDGVVVSISPSAQESILVTISPSQGVGKTKILITHTTTKS